MADPTRNNIFDDLEEYIQNQGFDIRSVGYDPYNARDFIERWERENGPYAIEKVPQGVKTETVPLGELKKLAEERMLVFDQELMSFTMGNAVTIEDTNGNRKLLKKRRDEKIDNVSALMDAYVAYKAHKDEFE
jgi:phage terminase large subunit-like protein